MPWSAEPDLGKVKGQAGERAGRAHHAAAGPAAAGGEPEDGADALRAMDAAGAGSDECAGKPGGERHHGPDRDGDGAGDRGRGAGPAGTGAATRESLPAERGGVRGMPDG